MPIQDGTNVLEVDRKDNRAKDACIIILEYSLEFIQINRESDTEIFTGVVV